MDSVLDHDTGGMDVCRPRLPKSAVAQWLGQCEQQRVRPGIGIIDRYIQKGDVHSAHFFDTGSHCGTNLTKPSSTPSSSITNLVSHTHEIVRVRGAFNAIRAVMTDLSLAYRFEKWRRIRLWRIRQTGADPAKMDYSAKFD
jgi:hypothetical protein